MLIIFSLVLIFTDKWLNLQIFYARWYTIHDYTIKCLKGGSPPRSLQKPISGIIHLAGQLESDNVTSNKKPIWERAIQNNLTNAYDIIENLIPFFDKNIIGKIILTSSLAYRRGGFDFIPYTASKGGITGLVRAYSRKLAPEILVNGLAPGIIDTKMPKMLIKNRGDELLKQIPQKRFGKPEEVASVIMFLLSEAASYINGQIINIDEGIINS